MVKPRVMRMGRSWSGARPAGRWNMGWRDEEKRGSCRERSGGPAVAMRLSLCHPGGSTRGDRDMQRPRGSSNA
jgi:hypothetical protein